MVRRARILASAALVLAAALLSACNSLPTSDLGEVSSILAPESPEVPGRPVEAYTRIARGLRACWLAPTAPLGHDKAYVFAAEAHPVDRGGKAFIVIYERTPAGERGLKAFAVALEPDGDNSKLGTQNYRVPEPFGAQMLVDVRRWAGGETGCTPIAPSFVPQEEPDVPPVKLPKTSTAA